MTGAIGYYVHHHGAGHRARALAIAEQQPDRFVLMGTGLDIEAADINVLALAEDRPDATTKFDSYHLTPSSLHYAPLNHDGIRSRIANIATWIETAKPAMLVCDVSVEVAMLARLMATPVIYVRLNGLRTDLAHMQAFHSAQMLLAPFHEALDDADTPTWVRQKTRYFPGITDLCHEAAPVDDVVLVVNGAGGEILDGNFVATAARATPDFKWRIIGPVSMPDAATENLVILGWVLDPYQEMASAAIVIGAAGDGVVSAVLALERPFICLPQMRPYDEQHRKARRLNDLGAALVISHWPPAKEWPNLLQKALMLDRAKMRQLHDPCGPRKALDFILSNI